MNIFELLDCDAAEYEWIASECPKPTAVLRDKADDAPAVPPAVCEGQMSLCRPLRN